MDEEERIRRLHGQLKRLRRSRSLLLYLLEQSLDERRALEEALHEARRLRVER